MMINGQKVIATEPVSGGCISNAQKVITTNGTIYFVKSSDKPTPLFREEAHALEEIKNHKAIRVPLVIEADDTRLVLEWIETEVPNVEFWHNFGRKLARLHIQLQEQFGFPIDNHIGSTPQLNPLKSADTMTWAEYFLTYRLTPMVNHPKLSSVKELHHSFFKAEQGIRQRLSEVNEPPSLLHGDLWGGNFLCAQEQTPVLVDPASYFGHREVDLAMSELFGGFAPEFYASYQKEFPLQPGYETRKSVYNLYHILNHWIIFGDQYRTQTLSILSQLN
jgi:protein-ribulosamine 3-kinase